MSAASAASVTAPLSTHVSPALPDLCTRYLGFPERAVPSVTFTVTFSAFLGRLNSLSVFSPAAAFVVIHSGFPLTVASGAFPVTCT